MAEYKVASTTQGTADTTVEKVVVDQRTTDAATGMQETTWLNHEWTTQHGYYRTIPECKIAADVLARWTIGDGYIPFDPRTQVILEHITGNGVDTFDDILENLDRTMSISGDAYAEIIRDKKFKILINLKVISPSSMRVVFNPKGIIVRYEQINKTTGNAIHTFKTNEILHLCNNRIADEIHGISIYESLKKVIEATNENFDITREIVRNFSKPKMMVELDTDDETKIATFITKFEEATNKGRNLYYPKGSVNPQVLAVPSNATMNTLPWREHLINYFHQNVGIPKILMGSSDTLTESGGKMQYLSFEQTVKQRQRYITTQVWSQLALKIELDFPTSLKNELLSDESKDASQGLEVQPNDTQAGVGA